MNRSGIDLAPKASLRIQFGDHITVVGPAAGIKTAEEELGNSPDILNRPQLIPLFLGIALGVAVGSIPILIPGLDTRLQIGLAGGPMIAAILLSQLGNIGSVVWYMPVASNTLFRDFQGWRSSPPASDCSPATIFWRTFSRAPPAWCSSAGASLSRCSPS